MGGQGRAGRQVRQTGKGGKQAGKGGKQAGERGWARVRSDVKCNGQSCKDPKKVRR